MAASEDRTEFQAYFQENRERHIEELKEFLRIPSMSSIKAHKDDLQRAAIFVRDRLMAAGMPMADVRQTSGHPVVFSHWQVDPALPTVLIYGHFDTQPVDPEALWQTPPFEPSIRDGRIFARGACDDKGNMFVPIKALEALTALKGKPPLNVKFLLEGEEEVGSPSLPEYVAAHREELKADLAVSADGSMFKPGEPSLTMSSKGLAAMQIDLKGAKGDLHSGNHGGAVQNPIHALAQLLASMRSADGRILVEGFYDDVKELTPEDKEHVAKVPFSDEEYMRGHEVDNLFGEPGYSTLERRWARPTLEVNGIWGGFEGEGVKTVLPSEAHAKITCRLVTAQDPERILDAIEAHVKRHLPKGVRANVTRFPGSSKPYHMAATHPAMRAAEGVLKDVYGQDPLYVRMGGTLPVAQVFQDLLGVDLLFFAFGSPDEQIHAPNEFWRLTSFDRGVRAYVALLPELARLLSKPA